MTTPRALFAADSEPRTLATFPDDSLIERDVVIRGGHDEYQYELSRWWGAPPGYTSWCMWLMLNPSTADGKTDDATIRRCMRFAYLWGHSGIIVVNLFAWRSRYPKELLRAGIDAIGPENDTFIRNAAVQSDRWVCGWGATPLVASRAASVAVKLWDPECLGVTKSGQPRHPLMVAYATPLQPFKPRPR